MHRHGYKGTKFHRQRDQREALVRSLAESLIIYESVETTLPKAKIVIRYTEKLITKAKKAKKDLHNRRMVVKELSNLEAAHKLVDEIAPKLNNRDSGYFRIKRTDLRRGDNAQMAEVSFVDDLKTAKTANAEQKKTDKAKKDDEKLKAKVAQPIVSKSANDKGRGTVQAPKRSGVRGNR